MKKYIFLLLLLIIACVGVYIYFKQTTDVSFQQSETATLPTRIEKIKDIGEWEFLSITSEDIVDTTAVVKRPWPLPDSKKRLVRIYKGTLRLGFDLKTDTREGWIAERGDTVDVKLPPVRLLDDRFIDEAATRPLIEEGDWTHEDRERLYSKAVRKMKREYLSPENIHRVETSALEQMESLLRSLGFQQVNIETTPASGN